MKLADGGRYRIVYDFLNAGPFAKPSTKAEAMVLDANDELCCT